MLAALTLLLLPMPGLGIRVLSTGRDPATHLPHYSGAELLHSALAGHDTVTLCARFSTYQFTYEKYGDNPQQVLLQLGPGSFMLSFGVMTENRPAWKSLVKGK